MEAFKGWLGPDGNRTDSTNAKASFTARRICRAVAKAEVSEPTRFYRKREDHQLKATPGINSDSPCGGKKSSLSNLAVMREMYGL